MPIIPTHSITASFSPFDCSISSHLGRVAEFPLTYIRRLSKWMQLFRLRPYLLLIDQLDCLLAN